MKKLLSYLVLPLIFVGGVAGMALAQTVSEDPILDLAKPVLEAALAGEYWLGASLLLVFLATAFYRYAPWSWAKSSAGKALSVLAISFGGAVATTLATGAAMSPMVAWAGLKVAIGAAGGYSLLKALLFPALAKLEQVAPGWLGPVISAALWVFRSGDPEAEAREAGDQAVADNPPEGAAGVVGEPRDVE